MKQNKKHIEVSGLPEKLKDTAIAVYPHIADHLRTGGITIYTEKRGEVGSVNKPITEKDFLRRIKELWEFDAKDVVRVICHRINPSRMLPRKAYVVEAD